jgi:hypothetical protein
MRRVASVLFVLLGTVAFILINPEVEVPLVTHPVHVLAACQTIQGSNANGTLDIYCIASYCTDPSNGLRVGYIVFAPFEWTTTNGTHHYFNVETVDNSGAQYCGPANSPTASGYATDGSGFYIQVTSWHYPTIRNSSGVQVYP